MIARSVAKQLTKRAVFGQFRPRPRDLWFDVSRQTHKYPGTVTR